MLPRNLLRRAAVLSALELLPGGRGKGGSGGGGGGGGEEEEEDEEQEGGGASRGSGRRSAGTGRQRRDILRRVLVRTRVVAHSGEEATLLWRVEREEEGHEEEAADHGCWLVASVARDGSDDFSFFKGAEGLAPLSPHPRLGPEQVVCAAAMELARGGGDAGRWMAPLLLPPLPLPEGGVEGVAEGRDASSSSSSFEAAKARRHRKRMLERAAGVLLGPSSRLPSSPPVAVVASAAPAPGVAVVETASAPAGKVPLPRPVRLLWTLVLDDRGCWGISEFARLN